MSNAENSTLDCHVKLLVPVEGATGTARSHLALNTSLAVTHESGSSESALATSVPSAASASVTTVPSRSAFELADVRFTMALDGDLRVRFAHTSSALQLLGIDKIECTFYSTLTVQM